jgi:hypothetical protein
MKFYLIVKMKFYLLPSANEILSQDEDADVNLQDDNELQRYIPVRGNFLQNDIMSCRGIFR